MKIDDNKTAWVLTSEYNLYDQCGEYYICAFANKPNLKTLAEAFSDVESIEFKNIMDGVAFLEHVLGGGGRRDAEEYWYNLKEVTLR